MSKYTTEVRYICEDAAGYDESKGYSSVDQIISQAVPKVFNFDLALFDDAYRNVLFSKILKHYYTREIGFETVGLWRLKLETKMQEIMPYFNQLYRSELLKFNPLYDTDLSTTHVGEATREGSREDSRSGFASTSGQMTENREDQRTTNGVTGQQNESVTDTENNGETFGSSKGTREGSNEERGSADRTDVAQEGTTENESKLHYDLYSDTPQGGLTGVNAEAYLTNARKITDTDNRTGKKDTTGTGHEVSEKNGEFSEESTDENTGLSRDTGKASTDERRTETRLDSESGSGTTTGTDSRTSSNLESSQGKDKLNSTESYVLHVVGKQSGASYSRLLTEFRETFLNIDMMVIESLDDLFMKLW